jgi:hypothetical protein
MSTYVEFKNELIKQLVGEGGLEKTEHQAISGQVSAIVGALYNNIKVNPNLWPMRLPSTLTSPPVQTTGVVNAASAIAGSVLVSTQTNPGNFTFLGSPMSRGATYPDLLGVFPPTPKFGSSGTGYNVEFWLDTVDATGRFEIATKGQNSAVKVLIGQNDGSWAYIGNGPTFYHPADGGTYLDMITLGAPGRYKIRLEIFNARFYGINCGPTDTISPTGRRNRWIVVGDSFSEPTLSDNNPWPVTGATGQATGDTITKTAHNLNNGNQVVFTTLTGGTGLSLATVYYVVNATTNTFKVAATYAGSAIDITVDYSAVSYTLQPSPQSDGWYTLLAHLTGLDIWSSSKGGTGYLAINGANTTFRGRIQDALSYNPDGIILAGGINDPSSSYDALYAEVLALISTIKAASQKIAIVILSPFCQRGVELGQIGSPIRVRNAIEAAAKTANCMFIDLMSVNSGVYDPFQEDVDATTGVVPRLEYTKLVAQANAGASAIFTSDLSKPQFYVQIGSPSPGTNYEVRKVTSYGGTPGNWQINVSPNLTGTHVAGEEVRFVGPSYQTGIGRQGGTTGVGNSDRYTGTDTAHPTRLGQLNIALFVADGWARKLSLQGI